MSYDVVQCTNAGTNKRKVTFKEFFEYFKYLSESHIMNLRLMFYLFYYHTIILRVKTAN